MRTRTKVVLIACILIAVLLLILLHRHLPFEDQWPRKKIVEEEVPRPLIGLLPQLPHLACFFNGSRAAVYWETYRDIWRYGDNLEEVLCALVDSAQSSVDVAVQEINLPTLAEALQESHQRGVVVRIILENKYSRIPSELSKADVRRLSEYARRKYYEFVHLADLDGNGEISLEEAAQRDALHILKQTRIPIIDDTADGSKGSGTMHHKFLVVDRRIVVCGSVNFTMSGVHGDFANPLTRGNTNHLLVFESPALARMFEEEFEIMWGDGPGGLEDSRFGKQKPHRRPRTVTVDGCPITVQFSPASAKIPYEHTSNGLIVRTIRRARRSVDLAQFVFSAQEIVDAIWAAHRECPDLQLRGIFDMSFATRYYSETLDMWQMALKERGKFETSSETGARNRPWSTSPGRLGLAILPEGDKMHHKFAVIDSMIVITGSHNWSSAANTNNDEALLIIESGDIAAHFLREMDRLSASIHIGPTKKLLQRVKERGGIFPPKR